MIGKWLSTLSANFRHLSTKSLSLSADSEGLLSDLLVLSAEFIDRRISRGNRDYVSFKLQPYISLTTIVTHFYYGILTYGEMNEMEDSSGKTIEQTKTKSTGCPVSPRWTILL
ncbi:MAG: hypothetical protein ACQEWV_18725 [Bacillota bacterium]